MKAHQQIVIMHYLKIESKRFLFNYFTDSLEDPFEAIVKSCKTIIKANEKIKIKLIDSGLSNAEFSHDWLLYQLHNAEFPDDWYLYYERINHLIFIITEALSKLFG